MYGRRFTPRWGSMVSLAVMLICANDARGVTPSAWKNTQYLVPEGDTSLESVFDDFRRLLNVSVDLTTGVKGPTASMGQPMTVEGLLDSLALRHGLTWFVFRDHLYVSRQSEAREARIKVIAARMPELKSYLAGIKLLDDRFSWVELPSRDEVIVQGPPSYVELVRENISLVKPAEPPAAPPPPPPVEQPQIMTFRLRYASAADDESGRVGVASMLSRLYGGLGKGYLPPNLRALVEPGRRPAVLSPASPAPANPQTAQLELVRQLNSPVDPNRGPYFEPARVTDRLDGEVPPSFEADTRLNMVIVRDKPSRRAEYERVIAALDVVTEQISLDATVIELPVNAMRDALASISSNAAIATSASGMPALVAPRALVERAFEQVSQARKRDGSVAILTQGIVFREDDPFSLDFADTRSLPQTSTTIWESLARSVLPLKVDNGDKERRIGLKLTGNAKYVSGRGINLKLELAEERNTPLPAAKVSSGRSTSASMSVDVREDQVLVLVNSSVWSGEDMTEPKGRAVLLSSQRWQSKAAPSAGESSLPPAAAVTAGTAATSAMPPMSQGLNHPATSLERRGP